jgi:type III secretion system low calcium response chaperone LcrH/SycD
MDAIKIPGQLEGETLEGAIKRLLDANTSPDPQIAFLSSDGIEALYAFGYGFYQSGNYEKAMHFFRFLTLIDIGNRKHWMGLGAAYQMLKQYERALQAYGQAALLDESDPYTHWHAAECFLAINNYEQAKEALTSTELTAKKYPQKHKRLLTRLQLLKKPEVKADKKKKRQVAEQTQK